MKAWTENKAEEKKVNYCTVFNNYVIGSIIGALYYLQWLWTAQGMASSKPRLKNEKTVKALINIASYF